MKIQEKEAHIKTLEQQLKQTEIQLKSSQLQIQQTENQQKQTENRLKQTEKELKSSQLQIQIKINQQKQTETKLRETETQLNNFKVRFYEIEYLNHKNRSIIQRLISNFPSIYILFNATKTGIKNALLNIKGHKAIKRNHLFDIGYYLKNNGDIRQSGMDPILHYMYYGFKEGRNPNPNFDGEYYLKTYKDVQQSNLNPLIHYSLFGIKEKRKTQKLIKITNHVNKGAKHQKSKNIGNIQGKIEKPLSNEPFIHGWLAKIGDEHARTAILRIDKNDFKINCDMYRFDLKRAKINNGRHAFIFPIPSELLDGQKHQIQLLDLETGKLIEQHEKILRPDPTLMDYENIKNTNLSMVNIHPFEDDSPLVSIIVLNFNGLSHLKRLFKNFKENIQYPNYEIIVVDNASSDNSIHFLEQLSNTLPLKIIKNNENKSFSKANNEAVKIANGDYILLLNNDIEPTYGWLNEMMQTMLNSNNVAVVGAKLVYPNSSLYAHYNDNTFKIQHIGISFKDDDNFIEPYNMGNGLHPFDTVSNSDKLRAGVTAAALLADKGVYQEVGGLDEKYIYGYEDVDFCLKVLKKGYDIKYCSKALLFHYEKGTIENLESYAKAKRGMYNREVLISKWDTWLREQVFIDKLNNHNIYSEESLNIAFIVSETGDNAAASDYLIALELGESFTKSGWNVSFISEIGSEDWYNIGNDVDIIISMLHYYNPTKIKEAKKGLVKVACLYNSCDKWISNPELHNYDAVISSNKKAINYIKRNSRIKKTGLLPNTTNAYANGVQTFKQVLESINPNEVNY